MSGNLYIIANAGRSGSTFLWQALTNLFPDAHVAHEDIPIQTAKPRYYNRAYEPERRQEILGDSELLGYLKRWRSILRDKDVIETGWTCYHLLPVLHEYFYDKIKVIVLLRHPFEVACSRATMGNFHPKTFYGDAHEVSPFDAYTIAPEWQAEWSYLNHFEKCFYWWYVIYREIFEFHDRYQIPAQIFRLEDMLKDLGVYRHLLDTLDYPEAGQIREIHSDTKNTGLPFMKETFPISEEWKAYTRHPVIIEYAEQLGYHFDHATLAGKAEKYQLSGFMPRVRHATRYWRIKRRGGKLWRTLATTS